jgi:trans-2,3-dihydro-3-hydroxyanthranilate isomerase
MDFTIVDVFAEQPYAGNQLAVFRGTAGLSDEQMQTLAREMNFSETTFILSDTPRDGGYDVRIFTVEEELPFAGHPTLGTAYVIRRDIAAADQIVLNLKVGQIPVDFMPDGLVWMQQKPPTFGEIYDPEQVAPLIGVNADDIDTRFPVQIVSTGVPFPIIPLKTREAVVRARLNNGMYHEWRTATGRDKVFLFCAEPYDSDNHLNARMFWGSGEDPATGSANGCLAGYLVKHRYFGTDSINVRVEQGYEIKRKSVLYLRAAPNTDDPNVIDVRVGGRVQNMASGRLA